MKIKNYCQNFKTGTSHWGNRCLKRCQSIAIKEFNGKQLCVNCYNDKIKQVKP